MVAAFTDAVTPGIMASLIALTIAAALSADALAALAGSPIGSWEATARPGERWVGETGCRCGDSAPWLGGLSEQNLRE